MEKTGIAIAPQALALHEASHCRNAAAVEALLALGGFPTDRRSNLRSSSVEFSQ